MSGTADPLNSQNRERERVQRRKREGIEDRAAKRHKERDNRVGLRSGDIKRRGERERCRGGGGRDEGEKFKKGKEEAGVKINSERRERRQREVGSWTAYTDVDMRSMLVSPLPPLWL